MIALVAACTTPAAISQSNAVSIAENYLSAGQPSGSALELQSVGTPEDAGSAWRVKIDAVLRDPAHPDSPPGPIDAIIDVDKATGEAHMFAQG